MREISADSSVVGFSDHKRHPPTAEERQKVADEMLEALAASTKRERLVFAEPEGGWRNALDSLVGVEAALAIQSVSQRESDEYILAAPNEFEDRVFLQVCIQVPNCCLLELSGPNAEQRQLTSTSIASQGSTASC